MRTRLAVLTAFLLAGRPASAQMLDFGKPQLAPAPRQGPAAASLASDLERQAQQRRAEAAPDALQATKREAAAAARDLARALVVTGDSMGLEGSRRVLLGRTLARRMDEIDGLIASVQGSDGAAMLALAARDLGDSARALEDKSIDPERPLRSALAFVGTLVPDAQRQPVPIPGLQDIARVPGMTGPAVEAFRDLLPDINAAQQWLSYHGALDQLAGLLASAIDSVGSMPSWVSIEARERLGAELAGAFIALKDSQTRAAATRTLEQIAALRGIVHTAARLEGGEGNRVRSALSDSLAAAEESRWERIADFGRLVQLAVEGEGLIDERQLLRQLRPAFRALEAAARGTQPRVVAVLTTVLRQPGAMNDPGVLTAVNTHRRAVDDLRLLADANARIAVPVPDNTRAEPEVNTEFKRIADNLLQLGQSMQRADTRTEAMQEARDLAAQTARYAELPGEPSLRATLTGGGNEQVELWANITGGSAAKLADQIRIARRDWLGSIAAQAPDSATVQNLETLRALMDVVAAAERLQLSADGVPGEPYTLLQHDNRWELSENSLASIASGFGHEVADCVAKLEANDAAGAKAAVEKIRAERATLLAAAELLRWRSPQPESRPDAISEITSPVRSNERDIAAAAADVCRFAEELAAARKLGNSAAADEFQSLVARRAADLRAALAAFETRAPEPAAPPPQSPPAAQSDSERRP
jgi:hypothetical protein